MPKFSLFTPYGHLAFSSRPSHGERIYNEMLRNSGVDENYKVDGNFTSELYADAMTSARVLYLLERAGNQADPRRAQETLSALERQHGIVPSPNATLAQRRLDLARIVRLNVDGSLGTIAQALNDLLGDELALYRTVRVDELPATVGQYPDGALLVNGNTPVRVMRTHNQVANVGVSVNVALEFVAGSNTANVAGQKVLFDAGHNNRAEVVTLEEASPTSVKATFTKPHDSGVLVTSGQYPLITSDKRRHLIILKSPWHEDTATRRQIAEVMHRLVKGTAVWQVMAETALNQAGPFKVELSQLDATPIGTVS